VGELKSGGFQEFQEFRIAGFATADHNPDTAIRCSRSPYLLENLVLSPTG
jgi:hypothetical protein